MRSILLSNWNVMRIIRLVLGIAVIAQAIYTREWMLGIVGLLFAGMALTNTGCCAAGACATSAPASGSDQNDKPVEYEEVVAGK